MELFCMQITGVGSRIVVQVASIMIMIVAIIGESKAWRKPCIMHDCGYHR